MSTMDKLTTVITVGLIFLGIPALFLYAACRRLTRAKAASGVILLLIGLGLAWASFEFMFCVGPHPGRYC
jgi:hypothetical protein